MMRGDHSRPWHKAGLLTLGFAFLAACADITPMKPVQPDPVFIAAAIEPDDEVRIETIDGRETEFVVATVEADAVVSTEGERIMFDDIQAIAVRSWEDPAHPCGGGMPVGCSLPEVIAAIDVYTQFKETFHESCEQHDYCYRHGRATYGVNQADCDDRFYADMLGQCGSTDGILDLLDVERLKRRSMCRLAADQFYAAVQRYGAKAFQTTGSTYCEYDVARKPR